MDPIRITLDEVKQRLDKGEPIFFVDTRNPVAWGQSDVKIKGAIRIPLSELTQHLAELPRDRTIVTYCT